jgi:hypothetical protein
LASSVGCAKAPNPGGLLLDLKRRGLAMAPELAVADGAFGFWQAIEEAPGNLDG